jgi:copper chaperone CopZ
MKFMTAVVVALMMWASPCAWTADAQAGKPATRVCTLKVSGMTCGGCEAAVRMAARSVEGVTEARASYAKARAEITYDPSQTTPQAIAQAITDKSGFKAQLVEPGRKAS